LLYAAAKDLEKAIGEQVAGIEDLTSDLAISSPQVSVQIDRDKAAALGVTASAIENAFYDAYGPRWVSTIYAPANEFKVLLELAPQYQSDPTALSLLYFKASGAGPGGAGQGSAGQSGTPAAQQIASTIRPLGGPPASTNTGGPVVPLDSLAHLKQ